MQTVNIFEAKSTLSRLVLTIEQGDEQEIIIALWAITDDVRLSATARAMIQAPQALVEPLRLLTHDKMVVRYGDTFVEV